MHTPHHRCSVGITPALIGMLLFICVGLASTASGAASSSTSESASSSLSTTQTASRSVSSTRSPSQSKSVSSTWTLSSITLSVSESVVSSSRTTRTRDVSMSLSASSSSSSTSLMATATRSISPTTSMTVSLSRSTSSGSTLSISDSTSSTPSVTISFSHNLSFTGNSLTVSISYSRTVPASPSRTHSTSRSATLTASRNTTMLSISDTLSAVTQNRSVSRSVTLTRSGNSTTLSCSQTPNASLTPTHHPSVSAGHTTSAHIAVSGTNSVGSRSRSGLTVSPSTVSPSSTVTPSATPRSPSTTATHGTSATLTPPHTTSTSPSQSASSSPSSSISATQTKTSLSSPSTSTSFSVTPTTDVTISPTTSVSLVGNSTSASTSVWAASGTRSWTESRASRSSTFTKTPSRTESESAAIASLSYSRNVSVSRSRSISATQPTSPSEAPSFTVSSSTSESNDASSHTESGSVSFTVTMSATHPLSMSASPEVTASQTKTQLTITGTQSNENSITRTQPTSSRTFEHPVTTSVPLIWREQGSLRFIQRPTRFAAPFRPIPIAPTLIFQLRGLAAIGDQTYRAPVGLSCYMRIVNVATRQDSSRPWSDVRRNESLFSAGVWIDGPRVVRMTQSVCSFPNIVFRVPSASSSPLWSANGGGGGGMVDDNPTGTFDVTQEFLVSVSFCANTSKMVDPRVPVHPCNVSQFHVAACPYTSEPMYDFTTNPSPLMMADVVSKDDPYAVPTASIFASNKSGNGRLVVELVGGSFEYSERSTYACALRRASTSAPPSSPNSNPLVFASSATLVDMCHLRCIFEESAWSQMVWFPSTNDTRTPQGSYRAAGALLAAVELHHRGVSVAPTCTGAGRRVPTELLRSTVVPGERLSCTLVNQPQTVSEMVSNNISVFFPRGCFVRVIGALEPRRFIIHSGPTPNHQPITLQRNKTEMRGMPIYVSLCDAQGSAYPIAGLNATNLSLLEVLLVETGRVGSGSAAAIVVGADSTAPGNSTHTVGGLLDVFSSAVDDGVVLTLHDLQLPTPPFGGHGPTSFCGSSSTSVVPTEISSIPNMSVSSTFRTPLLLLPTSIFGAPGYAPLCMSVVVGEVSGIMFINAESIALIADTASPLYVTPILTVLDVAGNALYANESTTIALPLNLTVSIIQPATNHSAATRREGDVLSTAVPTTVIVNGVLCEVVPDIPPVLFTSIATFPLSLSGIVISKPGSTFTLWVQATQSTGSMGGSAGTLHFSTVLWGEAAASSSSGGMFPDGNASISSSSCPTGSGSTAAFGVEQQMFFVDPTRCGGGGSGQLVPVNNSIPIAGGQVTIRGRGFQFSKADSMRCHLSNWQQLFPATTATVLDPPGSVGVSFVSSCEVRCVLPPQPYPINPGSGLAFDSHGQLVRSNTVATHLIGQLRLRGSAFVWSAPSIPLKVLGHPRTMDVRGWSSRLQSSLQLVIPSFSVVLLDATGNDLEGLDFSSNDHRVVSLDYSPSQNGQLNGSAAVSVQTTTCDPLNGAAVFPPISISPTSGEYGLTLSGPGLANYVLLLTIVDNVTINHNLLLLSPFPLCFVSVTLDRQSTENGRFPVPITVGAFRRNETMGQEFVDTSVTNVRILAVVQRDPTAPLPTFFDGSLVELGVGLEDCNNDYNNCGFLDAGVLTLGSLRFTGIPGVWYRITIRPQNASIALSHATFRVRVPFCPVNITSGNLTAVLQRQNESLSLPQGGVVVKGWRFPIPQSLQMTNSLANFLFSCIVGDSAFIPNGTTASFAPPAEVTSGALRCTIESGGQRLSFPGLFYDFCTARCFAQDGYTTDPRWHTDNPAAMCTTSGASLANSTLQGCCFNVSSNSARCDHPLTASVSMGIAAASTVDSAVSSTPIGTFTFIGPAEGAVVVPNVRASQTIFDTARVVPSMVTTTVDTIIVSLIDAKGVRLGTTMGNVTGVAWTGGYLYAKELSTSPLLVPGNYSKQLLQTLTLLENTDAENTDANTSKTAQERLCIPLRQDRLELLYQNNSRLTWVNNISGGFDAAANASFDGGPPSGATTWPVVDGEASLTNLALALPAVGYYDLPIFILSAGRLYSTNATVFVTPGVPAGLCLATSFAKSAITDKELLDPQPVIYLRDLAGNVYQSLRSNQVLFSSVSKYNYLMYDTYAVNANISFEYQHLVPQVGASSELWVPSDASVDRTPTAEYGGGIDVVQYLFSGLKLRAVHNVLYRLMFLSYALVHNVTTEQLRIKSCEVAQFAVEGSPLCSACPRGLSEHCIGGSTADCFMCNGSTSMNVTTNYWRFSSASEYAYSCPASSCLGSTETGTCVEGYLKDALNPLCGACERGFAQDFLGKCVPCAPTGVTVFVVVLFLVVIVIVVFAFIYLSVKGAISDDENDNHLVMMAKIFLNHTQVTGMLGEFRVNFTGLVLGYFNFVGAATGGSGISISPVNCLMPQLTFLDKMRAQLVLPVIVLLAVAASLGILHLRRMRKVRRLEREAQESMFALQQVLITAADDEGRWQDVDAERDPPHSYSILSNSMQKTTTASGPVSVTTEAVANQMVMQQAKRRKKVRNHVPFRQVFANASMILIFVLYQNILTQSIQTFNCLTLLTGRSKEQESITVLDADVLVECRGEVYENALSVAMYGVFIYALFLPLFTMTLVLQQARSSGWSHTYQQFSFLIRGFRLKFWYWEFVVVFRKTGLRLLIATISDPTLQSLIGIWFLTALFVMQTYAQPYVLPIHNHADQLCIMTALITLNIGLAFSAFSNECNVICGVFSILLIICNLSVLAFLLAQLAWGAYLRIVEEFGIDTPSGDRWISLRNLKNILLVVLKRQHKMSPSFRTYAPRPLNRALAKSVLGDDAGSDSGGDGQDDEDSSQEGDDAARNGNAVYQPPQMQQQGDAFSPASHQSMVFEEECRGTSNSDDEEMRSVDSGGGPHHDGSSGGALGPPRQDYSFLHVVPSDESHSAPRHKHQTRAAAEDCSNPQEESDPLNLFSRRL